MAARGPKMVISEVVFHYQKFIKVKILRNKILFSYKSSCSANDFISLKQTIKQVTFHDETFDLAALFIEEEDPF